MAQKTIEVILDGDLRYDTSVAWGLAPVAYTHLRAHET